MSSDLPVDNSESRTETNRRKRKIYVDDYVPTDRLSPTKRVLRSTTSTPVKVGVGEDEMSKKAGKWKDTRQQPLRLVSPKKASTKTVELPQRLMAQKDIPGTGRINSYSKADYIVNIAGVLRDTPYLDPLLKSPLGPLFDIPASKAALSGKLTHNMLCRMLPTKMRHEIWFVFANRPIRFSLKEFAIVTGLPCGPYPTDSYFTECKKLAKSKDAYWYKLMVGMIQSGLVKDIANLLWDDPKLSMEELKEWRKERAKLSTKTKWKLCLVLLIDGVLCPRSSAKMATKLTVEIVKDVAKFFKYPWGRESFELTIDMVKVSSQSSRSIDSVCRKLKKQTHVALKGLSIAFQLVFFAAVPAFNDLLATGSGPDEPHLAHPDLKGLEQSRNWNNPDILKLDMNPNTAVTSLIEDGYSVDGIDLSWPDEVSDTSVDTMLRCIANGYNFKNESWYKDPNQALTKPGSSKTVRGQKKKPDVVPPSRKSTYKAGSTKISVEDPEDTFVYNPDDFIHVYYYDIVRPQFDEENELLIELNERKFRKTMKALVDKAKEDQVFEREVNRDNLMTNISSADSDSESNNHGRKGSLKDKGKGKANTYTAESQNEDTESSDEWLNQQRLGSSGLQSSKMVLNVDVEKSKAVTPVDKLTTGYAATEASMDVKATNQITDVLSKLDTSIRESALEGNSGIQQEMDVASEKNTSESRAELAPTMGVDDNEIPDETIQDNELRQVIEDVMPTGRSDGLDMQFMDIEDRHVTEEDNTEVWDQTKAVVVWDGKDFLNVGDIELENISTDPMKDKPAISIIQYSDTQDAAVGHGLSPVDEDKKNAFFKAVDSYRSAEYLLYKIQVPRGIFRQIAAPKQHVGTNHMELMLGAVWERLGEELRRNRVVILGNAFCHFMKLDAARYKKKMGNPFEWDRNLVNMVNGTFFRGKGHPGCSTLTEYMLP